MRLSRLEQRAFDALNAIDGYIPVWELAHLVYGVHDESAIGSLRLVVHRLRAKGLDIECVRRCGYQLREHVQPCEACGGSGVRCRAKLEAE
jgi:hypothetical protein